MSSFTFSTDSLKKSAEGEDSKVNFRIQLCEYRTIVPVRTVELLREIGAKPIKSSYGSIYVTPPYSSESEAAKELPKFRALGFENAHAVVEMGDELLTIENFNDLYKSDSTPEEDRVIIIHE